MRMNTYSYRPDRVRKCARNRTLTIGVHETSAAWKISSEKGQGGMWGMVTEDRGDLQVSNYMRGEGDLGCREAPLV